MDKAILRKFAIESRQDLMSKIKNKINTYYIDEEFSKEQKGDLYVLSNESHSLNLTNEEYQKRELLIKRIKELSYEQVVEEAAYTWFNRIIAIRYMEINDILPLTRDNQSLGIRVLSSKDNTPDPEILKFSNLMNSELDIEFDKDKYIEFKDDNSKFKYILLLVCKKLGKVIPQVFDGITDYIDILIPDNLLNDTGFITKIINDVPEDNYNQVEIIGWLYQYYNQTEKDRVISAKKAYKKNEIAYATQLFTPDWIVKYMVENSLGKYWLEHTENSNIKRNWEYFIDCDFEKKKSINPVEIKFLDPCCGSGHILSYAFDVFYQIYIEMGYNKSDIPELILKYNLYGFDIDDRAGQLSILSILLKAREFDKNIFNKKVTTNLNIISIQESNNNINESLLALTENSKKKYNILCEQFKNAKEYGSLIKVENEEFDDLINEIENDNTIFSYEAIKMIKPLVKQWKLLLEKYDVVVTNPPYMNNNVMSNSLKKYISDNYKEVKSDLFSAFILRNTYFAKKDTYLGYMTPYVWMFISSYEELRKYLINNLSISSLVQLEYSALEEATVPICTFILKNSNTNKEVGNYIRLTDFTGGMKVQNSKYLDIIKNHNDKYLFKKNSEEFLHIPGSPIAYWITENFIDIFKNSKSLGEISSVKQGIATSNNNIFLRLWYEVSKNNIFYNCKNHKESLESSKMWYPYNKGGEYRKWYGNNDYLVNWKNDGESLKAYEGAVLRNPDYYFRKSITWSLISSSNIAFRSKPTGHLFDVAGMSCFPLDKDYNYILGFNNTKIVRYIMNFIAPTLNFQVGDIAKIPIIFDENYREVINLLVEENIKLSKQDWDSFETSWDFKLHPLISNIDFNNDNRFLLKNIMLEYKIKCEENFNKVKQNEEKLNNIFSEIYKLNNVINIEIEDKDITIRKADEEREIKSLISYAVGCMFGRYSLDNIGLICADGNFDTKDYKIYNADIDNIIPITDEAYFADDIVARFKKFISIVYGSETLNKNIDYIAETLGKRGTETSDDTIRRYFVNDFFNDHVKTYQKRPIYWLFDSGKKNGFKALVYMHRYNDNLIPKIRLDYLHRIQTTYEKLLSDVNYRLTTDLSMNDKKIVQNKQIELNAKLQEIKEYDEKIAHIANKRISIDLDDGVKENYNKFKDILAKIK